MKSPRAVSQVATFCDFKGWGWLVSVFLFLLIGAYLWQTVDREVASQPMPLSQPLKTAVAVEAPKGLSRSSRSTPQQLGTPDVVDPVANRLALVEPTSPNSENYSTIEAGHAGGLLAAAGGGVEPQTG